MRRLSSVAALLAILVLTAMKCGGEEVAPGEKTETHGKRAATQVLRIATEEPKLDPGFFSFILPNLMDPLVTLGDDLQPIPALAVDWGVKGTKVTFFLRPDATWTNGDPVTAKDFAYSWRRTLSPQLDADLAYLLFGIRGAREYNACTENCDELRHRVGVTAVSDYTLEVELTSPQPWFIHQVASLAFLPVHPPTVKRFRDKWAEPENIVTNGPFKLESWEHGQSITLVKWEGWRGADEVALTRVQGKIFANAREALRAFAEGDVDVVGPVPPEDQVRLKDTPEWVEYPAFITGFFAFNLENIPDVIQRQAMALVLDRESIAELSPSWTPATSFTPRGMPGYDLIRQDFLPPRGDLEQAKKLMSGAKGPKTRITLWALEDERSRLSASAAAAAWKELGIETALETYDLGQLLENLGQAPKRVDAFQFDWIGVYSDAFAFLETLTCQSPSNRTSFCRPRYDMLVERARVSPDTEARYELYGELEAMLTGANGAMPIIPVYWDDWVFLEQKTVRDTFAVDPFGLFDLSKVVVEEE